MRNPLTCSSHTISGVMPGGPVASRHDFRSRVEACARAGYSGMCLHLRDYAEQRQANVPASELRAILRGNGMVHNSLEFLTGWDDQPAPAALEPVAWAAALALDAPVLNVGSSPGAPRLDRDRALFEALCARAAAEGVRVALEVVPWSRAPDLPSALRLTDGIANAGLVIDCWHVFRGGIALADVAALDGSRILSVQINDGLAKPGPDLVADTLDRRLCGEGAFDLRGFLTAIRQTGTTAPIAVEVISPRLAAMEVDEAASVSAHTAQAVLDGMAARGSL
ncbi:sugar phosphate isomerase/epimerase family protein [Paracoccus yeei]|uniref:Sugar phosphate isomerase/epimerase n=1 Tax=Paracoccus yeei TaxID=147645 RepID=A0A5P2QY43_9RHOB|nr:sugar phosphate isomerase/epimerase [Paracoccus yeei]QEU09462.1 sugar phosphate isomerase/epimerase [Paracoccus yeei]